MVDFREHPGHQALILMASPSAFPWTNTGNLKRNIAEMDILHYYDPSRRDSANKSHIAKDTNEDDRIYTINQKDFDMHMDTVYELPEGSETEGFLQSGKSYHGIGPGLIYSSTSYLPDNAEWAIGIETRKRKEVFQLKNRLRVEMGSKLLHRWESIAPLLPRVQNSAKYLVGSSSETRLRERLNCPEKENLVLPRAKNLDLSSSTTISGAFSNLLATLQGRHGDMTSGLLLFLLPAIYGAIHLSAWTFQFPTAIEHKLWKIACLDLVASLPVFLIGSFAREVGTNGVQFTQGDMAMLSWFGLLFLVVNIPATVVARTYLVVESFISLRRVPVGVYATVPWSDWVPHI